MVRQLALLALVGCFPAGDGIQIGAEGTFSVGDFAGRIRVLSGAGLAAGEGLDATLFDLRGADGDWMQGLGAIGDIDGDGWVDLVTHAQGQARLLLGAEVHDGASLSPAELPTFGPPGWYPEPVGDVTGDGIGDVVSNGGSDDPPEIYSGAALLAGEPAVVRLTGSTVAWARAAGNIDGDRVADLLATRVSPPTGPANELTYPTDEIVFFGPLAGDLDPDAPGVVLPNDSVAVGDVSGDGRADMALLWPDGDADAPDSEALVFVDVADTPEWTEADATYRIAGAGTSVTRLFSGGDLDGDGRAELWVAHYADRLEVYSGADLDGRVFGAADFTLDEDVRRRPAVGDLDQDGRVDLAVTLDDDGHRVEIFLAPSLGESARAADHTVPLSSPGVVFMAGDFDGDGVEDLVVEEPNWEEAHE